MRIIKTTCALAILAAALFASTPAHAQSPTLNPHTYALPSTVVGGQLRLKTTHHYADGSTSYAFEVYTMDAYDSGWVYYTVNVQNPTHADALATRDAYRTYESKARFGGTPDTGWLKPEMYGGHDVFGVLEIGKDNCRTNTVFAYRRAAVDVEVASFGAGTCGVWVATYNRRITNALLNRIP